jgi:putative ABC transport system permease protein
LMIGVAAGALTAPLFGGLLVNVSPRDPVTFAATALLVLATAVLASAPPALRAVKVDPMRVLKGD